SHETMVYVRRDLRNGLVGDKPMLIGMAGFGNTHLAVDGSDGSWWQGVRRLFAMGMRHIAEGPDHLLFLLALLLPAPLLARGGRWVGRQGVRASARTIVGVVSGFTGGHSISLALAAAGWVAVPTRAVEVLIAVSILVSCLHAWRPVFAGREVWIASAFGLVHGLAFAEVLSGLDFDATTLALSLLGFNLGIEAMQLLVIAATLPLLLLLGGGARYAVVRLGGAAFAAACATGWIAERAFGLANPLQPVADWLAPPPLWFAVSVGVASVASACVLAGMRWGSGPRIAREHETPASSS
ncbi:MAG: HupE/UreJ family protein, partial [Betaproteobacteria bacterium]